MTVSQNQLQGRRFMTEKMKKKKTFVEEKGERERRENGMRKKMTVL